MINCKLIKNIGFGSDGVDADGCGSTEISVAGIRERMYLYNIGDIERLVFDNDRRYDNSLLVRKVLSTDRYYYLDGSDTTYSESESDGIYTHTLTTTLSSINIAFEDILVEAERGRYLVVFKPNNSDYLRMFGWGFGATMTASLTISSDTTGYVLTFNYEGTQPLLSVLAENFNEVDKVFTPLWEAALDYHYCVYPSGRYGYVECGAVVKVNEWGEALDADDRLCSFSGAKQCAYICDYYRGESWVDGYDVLGYYSQGDTVQGVDTYWYDEGYCTSAINSISTNVSSIILDSSSSSAIVTVETDDWWEAVSIPENIHLSVVSGVGSTQVIITAEGGVSGTLVFENQNTLERVEVTINSYYVTGLDNYSIQYPDQDVYVIPQVTGGSGEYDYVIDDEHVVSTEITSEGWLLIHLVDNSDKENYSFDVTISHKDHPSESKTITISVIGVNIEPLWQIISRYCE